MELGKARLDMAQTKTTRPGLGYPDLAAELPPLFWIIAARLIPHRRSNRLKQATSVAMLSVIATNACSARCSKLRLISWQRNSSQFVSL
jgi:hypothetical protein